MTHFASCRFASKRGLVVTAAVTAAAMIAASVSIAVVVVMVVAANVRIVAEGTGNKGFHGCVRIAGNTAIEPDACCCQGHLRTAADSTADQYIGIEGGENPGQSAVTAAVGVHDLGGQNLPILDIVDLKLLRVTKMLENLAVFVGNCDSHNMFSFRFFVLGVNELLETAAAVGLISLTQAEISPPNFQRPSIHQGQRQLLAGGGVELLDRGPGHVHESGTALLGKPLLVNKTDGFVFIDSEADRFFFGAVSREKSESLRVVANLFALSGSWHRVGPPSFQGYFHYIGKMAYVNNEFDICHKLVNVGQTA